MTKHKIIKMLSVVFIVTFCMLLLACAPRAGKAGPQLAETGTEAPGGGGDAVGGEVEATPITWSAESDCAMCHENSATTLADLTCEAAQGDPSSTCLSCHADSAAVGEAHANVTTADIEGDSGRLKRSKVEDSACLSCHNLDELAVTTAGVTALTDDDGRTANPHEVTTVDNINGAHDKTTCSSCHKMHSGKEAGETAATFCRTCHHGGKYECYTCHP